jgi:methylisocitrate lyase
MRELSGRLKPLGRPLLFNMVTSGRSRAFLLQKAGEFGFELALCPLEPLPAMHKSVKDMLDPSCAAGSDTRITVRLMPFATYNNFVRLPEAIAREARFTRV